MKMKKQKKGISTVLMTVITIMIVSVSLGLIISVINNEANYSADTAQYLQSVSEKPMIYETWHNGVVQLVTNRPFEISHIILPNGQIINKSISVQNTIPLGNILVGNASWAIIVTNEGTWYNVTHLTDPYIGIIDPQGLYYGIPWNSTVLQNVGLIPNFYVTQGVKMLNFTATKINAFVGYEQEYGVTNVLGVTYVGNNTGWVNITFYAPIHSTGNVPNPYFWKYYTQIEPVYPFNPSPGSFNPYNNYYYYLLVTTNPYAYMMPPIWYSAIYANATFSGGGFLGLGCYYETNYTNPRGAINFTYSYVNATIGVYVPIYNISNGNIGYLYIPFNIFEITDVVAYVPSEVYGSIYQVNPFSTILKRPANATGGQWVYIPYSWVVAPVQQSPNFGTIDTAYDPNIGNTTLGYPAYPPYIDFPASTYTGFPSYYGFNYTYLLMYLYSTNDTFTTHTIKITHILGRGQYYYTYETIPDYIAPIYTFVWPQPYYVYAINKDPSDYVNVSDTAPLSSQVVLLNQNNDPIEVYTLSINLNTGDIILYGFDSMTGNWIYINSIHLQYYQQILSASPQNFFYFLHYLPVYIQAPYGTYLMGASTTGGEYQSVYSPPNS